MPILSESETKSQQQLERVLLALPVLRRWLVRSSPVSQSREGHRSPPLSHVRVLIHLAQHGPMTMGKLARGLGISCSTATECVEGLEGRGRAVKHRSQLDRRQVVVSLTAEAEAVASQVLSQRKAIVEKVLRQLSPIESRAFVKGLVLLAESMELSMDRAAQVLPEEQPLKDVVHA